MNRLSVITICFNNLEDVKKTCASVDCQLLKPNEHIIIDGSTKPDIKEWLESTPQPLYRKWLCERDKGIADAFNKGVNMATGNVLSTLNSGDELYDETSLQRVMSVFDKDNTIMWLNGKLNMMRGGLWVIVGKPFEKSKLYRGMRGVFHPTMYVKKEVYNRRGMFDINIKYAMDYDFLCRIADEKNSFIDYPLATFDPTGISSTQYLPAMEDAYACYRKYYGKSFKQTLWSKRLAILHYLLNSKFGKWLYRMKVKAGLQNA